jgi:hypothetical protein
MSVASNLLPIFRKGSFVVEPVSMGAALWFYFNRAEPTLVGLAQEIYYRRVSEIARRSKPSAIPIRRWWGLSA